MIQPSVLNAIGSKREFRGTGLLARFLYAYPKSKVGRRKINPDPVSDKVRSAYVEALSTLTEELAYRVGASVTLTLDDEAQAELCEFQTKLEPSLAADEELGSLADWGGKNAGTVVRNAAVLHLAQFGVCGGLRQKITKETIKSSIKINRYYKSCAINAFAELGADPVMADAIYLLDRIES